MFLIPSSFYKVKKTKHKGRGIFAKKDIEAGTVIGDYLGRVIPEKKYNWYEKKYGLYGVFVYNNDENAIFPDPQRIGIHLINHSCSANCVMVPYRSHLLYVAHRHIFPGEEITVFYLISPPESDDLFHYPCYCQSPVCRGTMHTSREFDKEWERYYKRTLTQSTKKITKIGQVLEPLPNYPAKYNDQKIYNIFGTLEYPPLIVEDKTLPSVIDIREIIRSSGRCLYLKALGIYIYGIMNGMAILIDPKHIKADRKDGTIDLLSKHASI